MANTEDRLRRILYRAFCPESMELYDYDLGVLSRERTTYIQDHLKECPHCRREIQLMQASITETRADLEFNHADRIRVLVARLVKAGSPGWTPALQGVRGGEGNILTYETEGMWIVLDLQADSERMDLKAVFGLLTGADTDQEFEARLVRNGELAASSPVDEFGNFTFLGLDAGRYELILVSEGMEVHIEELQIE